MEAYHDLVADGGRPSHPVTLGRDVIDNPEDYKQYEDILWFWHFRGAAYYQEFRYQLIYWREFRNYQDQKRKYYVPRNRWQEYVKCIQESQEDLGCTWDLRVMEDRHRQNRLEDWNEFRAFYYRKLKAYQKQVDPAEQNLRLRERNYEDAQARLTDVITDSQVLNRRIREIVASQKEVDEANSRFALAEANLKAAKRKKTKRRTAMVRVARQDFRLAEDNLKHVSGTEEMKRLRDGLDLATARESMLIAQGGVRAAKLEVKRWEVFLKWIDNQYPAVAAECGVAGRSPDHGPYEQTLRPRSRRQTIAEPRSILRANSSSKIYRPLKREPHPHTKQAICAQILLSSTVDQPPVKRTAPPRRSKRLEQAKERQMGILHDVHSARVSKAHATSHGKKQRR